MNTYKVKYAAGFGHNTQNHKGFGPTIYIEESVEYKSDKDYFDYVDFYKAHSKPDDTYFHISWLEDRPLSEREIASRNAYRVLRDECCEKAKKEFIKNKEPEAEHHPTHGDWARIWLCKAKAQVLCLAWWAVFKTAWFLPIVVSKFLIKFRVMYYHCELCEN